MNFSRFVKSIKIPLTRNKTRFTTWQDATWKDVERALVTSKIMWKFVSHPIKMWSLKNIARRILTALILHNVVISNRVMGDMNKQDNPANLVDDFGNF